MTSRELRNQRREAERKARKLEYQQNRTAASGSQTCGAGSLAGEPVARPDHFAPGERSSSALALNPDLFDEFSAEEQMEMMAIRARVHAGAGLSDVPEAPVASEVKSGPTGPTTPEGKATSSGNSLKHGLASGRVIIPGEDPAAFEALLSDLIKENAPANETESLLVQQMAQSWWLTQRAIRLQNEAFTETDIDTRKLALFLRYQTTQERAFYKALNTLAKLKQSRAREACGHACFSTKQAVSSRRKSAPEFVSQKLVGAMHASPTSQEAEPDSEFVSQNRHQSLPEPEFVSQNSNPTSDR